MESQPAGTAHASSARWLARPRAPTHSPPRILLAEDDPDMRALVAQSLRKDGYEVIEVPDGGRLLVSLATTYGHHEEYDAYDLLISDVRMPVCSGLEIVEGLRKAHWKIPVILMTAFGDAQTRARAEAFGAVLFDKPFDVDDLRTAVMNMVPRG
jgi:DNA-binding response OmpR family regulator